MGTPEVGQPAVEGKESKSLRKWWTGVITGLVVAFIAFRFSYDNQLGFTPWSHPHSVVSVVIEMFMLLIIYLFVGVTMGLIGGFVGQRIHWRWPTSALMGGVVTTIVIPFWWIIWEITHPY